MARDSGPECSQQDTGAIRRNGSTIATPRSADDVIAPYAWLCFQCGELHHVDMSIPEEYLTMPEREERRLNVQSQALPPSRGG
jgi:hypothetical protein